MKKYLCVVLCALLLAGCVTHSGGETLTRAGYTFTDDTGATVTAPKEPKTVAVLLSSLADIWVTAGGKVDISVGETVQRGFADADVILVDSGAGKTINVELLIASKPELVIYSAELAGQTECAEILRDAGIATAGFAVETFDDYLRVLKICTDILETQDRYETYGVQAKKQVDTLIAFAQSHNKQPDILFVRAGSSARYTKAKTADNHFVCVMLKELGSRNIADKAPILLDGLSTEEVLLADPDVIFFTTMGDETAGAAYMQSLLSDPVWQSLTVVRAGKVYHLPKELFQYKPNSRWAEAYEYLIELLYGETE